MAALTPMAISAIEDFENWREFAGPKSHYTYYVGHILADRGHLRLRDTAEQVARHVYKFYEAGEITLVQQRVAPDNYRYMAIRLHTSKRRPKIMFTPDRLRLVASA